MIMQIVNLKENTNHEWSIGLVVLVKRLIIESKEMNLNRINIGDN